MKRTTTSITLAHEGHDLRAGDMLRMEGGQIMEVEAVRGSVMLLRRPPWHTRLAHWLAGRIVDIRYAAAEARDLWLRRWDALKAWARGDL